MTTKPDTAHTFDDAHQEITGLMLAFSYMSKQEDNPTMKIVIDDIVSHLAKAKFQILEAERRYDDAQRFRGYLNTSAHGIDSAT